MFDEPGFPRGADVGDDFAPLLDTFVYCSRAAEGIDDGEVGRIVELSQRRNAARSITGVLVFGNGVFFQIIEGPAVQIDNLIAILRIDPRHHDIVSLERSEDMRERLYPNWEMERVEADSIRAVLQDALESAEGKHNVAALRRILKHLDSRSLDPLGRI